MKIKNESTLYMVSLSRKLSLYSFACGVLITMLNILTREDFLISLGLLYTVIAFLANAIVLLMLIGTMFIHQHHWKDITISSLILLANIPACLTCIYLATNTIAEF